MDRNVNILFLGGAKRVSLARHLKTVGAARGLQVGIFSYELDRKVPIGIEGEVVKGLKWNDPKLMDDIEACIAKYHIDIVLPFVDPAIEVASRLKEAGSKAYIPVSGVEICRTMFDKVLSSEWFSLHGIPQPERYISRDGIRYPAILKPRGGSASKGIIVAYKPADLDNIDLSAYLIQEYISDRTEYTVDCYVSKVGEPVSIVPRIRLETAGGEAVRTRTLRDGQIIEVSRRILSSSEFRGPVTIQFLRNNAGGVLYVMEINPRFGGGVIASIEAGSRILDMLFAEFEGGVAALSDGWEDGMLMTRFFEEVIYHADSY